MKRLFLVILLLSVSFVQAQRECTANLTEEECELYQDALINLHDEGRLAFRYNLSLALLYDTTSERHFGSVGDGFLERNADGAIVHLELNSSNYVRGGEVYGINIHNTALPVVMRFEENLFASRLANDAVMALEFDVSSIDIESLVPSLYPEVPIESLTVENQAIATGEVTLYQYAMHSTVIESPFRTLYPLVFGEVPDELNGTAYYEGNIAIEPNSKEVYGTVFRSSEIIDGANFGQELPITVEVYFSLVILDRQQAIREPITELETYLEDGADYELASRYGFWGFFNPILLEPTNEIFVPLSAIGN